MTQRRINAWAINALALALGSAQWVACGGNEGEGSDGDGDAIVVGGDDGVSIDTVCGADASGKRFKLRAAEVNNYSFASTLNIEEQTVAAATELTFDWSALTVDFIGHEVDPIEDIDMVALIVWKLTGAELADKLNRDDLKQSDFEAIAMLYNENATTSGGLFELTEFGTPIDQDILLDYLDPEVIDPATHSYTVMATTGTTPGKDTRMVKTFHVDTESTNTHLALEPDSATLDYTVHLDNLEPITVPAGTSDITIDWSSIAVNAMGSEFDPTSITQVAIGRFDESVAELQDQFLDLDLIAEQLYWGEVLSGSKFSMAETVTEAGAAFSGIDDDGTWMVGLRCGTCTNPSPWYLTELKPCAAD